MAENRGISHRESFVNLQSEFANLQRLGAGGKDFESVAMGLLRAFENTRKKNEGQIARIREEIKFCEATNHACDMFEQLLMGLIGAARVNLEQGHEPSTPPSPEGVVADTDVLKTICVCGCQDEEDTKTCKCLCHQGQHCGNANCVVCDARFVAKPAPAPEDMAVMDTGATGGGALDGGTRVTVAENVPTKKRRGRKADAGRDQTS